MASKDIHEASIIAACRRGDRKAQKALFETYSNGMLALCKRYIRDSHYAEDVLLSGFYKFFATIDRFVDTEKSNIGAWLKTIMVHECISFLRSKNNIAFSDEGDAPDTVMLNTQALDKMHADAILKLVETLPDGYRTVFNLYVVEGFNHREIADMLGISQGASKSQLSRAKKYLQGIMEKSGIFYEI